MLTALIGLIGVGGVAGLALHLFGWSGILGFGRTAKAAATRIPRWAWIALAVVAVVVGGYLLVQHKIHQAYANGSRDGHAQQFAHDQAAMDKARAAARAFKQKLDTANTAIHNQESTRHDQVVTANHALADALRLRVQRAQAQPGSRGIANLPGAAGLGNGTGGPQPQADVAMASGADQATVCVPAGPLIDYAEQADNDHDGLEKNEDAWKRYEKSWPSRTGSPVPQ